MHEDIKIIFEGYQKNSYITNKGSLFMACCLKGGLSSDMQILNIYEWLSNNIGFFFPKFCL